MASVNVGVQGYAKLVEKLKALNKDTEIAIKRTISDLKSRAPAQITKATTAVYGIKSGDVTAAGKAAKKGAKTVGSIKVSGVTVDTIQLTYSGRVLTPTHFKMKPKARPKSAKDENGRTIRKAKSYTVTAEIFKGQRKALGSNVFLGTNRGAGDIPFQRTGRARTPIEAIKTVSIPQMIQNETVAAQIQTSLDELLMTRLNHHIERLTR